MLVDIFDIFELLDLTHIDMHQLQSFLAQKGMTIDDIKEIDMPNRTIILYNGNTIKLGMIGEYNYDE